MRTTLVALVLGATALGLATPSVAATPKKLPKAKPLVVKDAAGDATGLNSQGGLAPASPPALPASPTSLAQADILSFSLGRKDNGTKVKALVGTMTLAGAPATGTDYRIRMSAPGCSTYFLELEFSPLGQSAFLRNTCTEGEATSAGTVFDPIEATITGKTITWTVPISALSGDVKVGTPLTVTGAQTSGDTGAAIVPGIDEVLVDATYVVGS